MCNLARLSVIHSQRKYLEIHFIIGISDKSDIINVRKIDKYLVICHHTINEKVCFHWLLRKKQKESFDYVVFDIVSKNEAC